MSDPRNDIAEYRESDETTTAQEIAKAVQGNIGGGFDVDQFNDRDHRRVYTSTSPEVSIGGSSCFTLFTLAGEIFVVSVRKLPS
jgi:hypothetical protein